VTEGANHGANDHNQDGRYGIPGYGASTYGDGFADVYDDWYSGLDDSDFVRHIVSLLPNHPVTVLELGVGTGRLLAEFRTLRHHNDTLAGIDSSLPMLDKLRARNELSDIDITIGDFSQQLPDGPFDLIFVGYSVTCTRQVVSQRILRPGRSHPRASKHGRCGVSEIVNNRFCDLVGEST